jgi:hypothetical protein
MQSNILRNYEAWFRYRVIKVLREKHPNLFQSKVKSIIGKIANLFTHKNSWALIGPLIVAYFVVAPYFPVPIAMELELKNAELIIDQRTSNIAAIVSMSLVVVGFLINNLAVKSPTTYKLLFKNSLLYFTIYMTLSTIGCFMIVSLLRDELSGFVFTRLVIAASYLALTVLFLIGYLFRKIVLFTNEKVIATLLKKELLQEGVKKLRKILIRQYSEEMYPKLFRDFALPEFRFSLDNIFGANISVADADEMPNVKPRTVIDLNIWILCTLIFIKRLFTKDIYFSKVTLEVEMDNNSNIIWSNEKPNGKLFNWLLRRCMRTKKIDEKVDEDEYRKEFDLKIVQLAEEGKYQNLELTLEAYIDLYDLQMTNQK